jgi:hypothetical protein
MGVARLHSKLFAAAARELDHQVRAQFLDSTLRPEYLRDFQRDLEFMHRYSEEEVEVAGRFPWVKRALRRLLRPFSARQGQMNRMIIARLGEVQDNLLKLAAALSEARAALREEAELLAAELRREVADEVHRLLPEAPAPPAGAPRVAVARAGGGARLLLGPVDVQRPGYEHIDIRPGGHADLVADLGRLPVPCASVEEIVVANVLESFPLAGVRHRLLPHWASLLKPGGRLVLVADDFGAVVDRLRDGQMEFGEAVELLFQGGDRGPLARRSAFSPELLGRLVTEAGLTRVAVTDRRQQPEWGAYGFELVAYRP